MSEAGLKLYTTNAGLYSAADFVLPHQNKGQPWIGLAQFWIKLDGSFQMVLGSMKIDGVPAIQTAQSESGAQC